MISKTHHVTVGWVIALIRGSAASYCINRLFPATARVTTGGYGNVVATSWWAFPVGGPRFTPVARLHYEYLGAGAVVVGGACLTRVRLFFRSRVWRHLDLGGRAGVISSAWQYQGTGRVWVHGNNWPDFCDHYIIIANVSLKLTSNNFVYYGQYGSLRFRGTAIATKWHPPNRYYNHSVNARFTILGRAQVDWVSDRVVDSRGGMRLFGSVGIGAFTHIILSASGRFRLIPWSSQRRVFPSRWYYVGIVSVVVLPNMWVNWVTDYQIEGSGLGTVAGNIEIVFVSAWETTASAGMMVWPDSQHSLAFSCGTDVRLVVSGDSRCFVLFFWFSVDTVSIAGTALLQLHWVFTVLPRVTVDGTAGNPLDYDATLIVGSDSARGYSVVVETSSVVSTHMTLQVGGIIVRVGGTRRINTCYLVIPSSGASVWGASAVTCQNCYV